MWYAGIDWADDHHDLVILDDVGEIVHTLHVAHSAEGIGDLIALLRATVTLPDQTVAWDQLVCVIETTHGLLITALLEAGVPVYPSIPKRSTAAATHPVPRLMALMPTCSRKLDGVTSATCRV